MYVYTHSPWQPFRHVSITPRDFFRQWSLSRAGTVVCLCVPSMRRSLSCLRVTVRSEIRSKPLQFLKEGEKIVLISTKNGKRFALCVLEFQGCVKIKMSLFMKYYNLHRVSAGEFADFTASWPSMDLVGHGILIWSVNSECASQSRWSEGVRCGSTFDLRSCFRTTSASTGFWFSHHRSRIWKNNDTYIYI